jgi:p-hydroxybenzoate 3-monooxygenase
MPEVAIAGAGPAGLVLAHLLQRAGVTFVVLERQQRPDLARHPKAGLIEYRTVQLLRDAGIAGPVLEFGTENRSCEFRTPTGSAVLDYGLLTGGRPHYIYPQHQLVRRLADTLIAAGGQVRFGYTVREARPERDGVTLSVAGPDGGRSAIGCQAAVGCDGARSAVGAAMTGTRVTGQSLPVRWLVSTADAPPLEDHTIYAAHPRGFAGQMRRGPAQTRYYLEVPASDTAADWPEDRVRDELSVRLGAGGRLEGVPFSGMDCLDLRVRMTEPMQQDRLFLAGDAAHLITPAGGKGMNLAIQDAVELAHGLIQRSGPAQDNGRLSAYSRTRLPAIWRAQAFSSWFLRVILASLADGAGLQPGALAGSGGPHPSAPAGAGPHPGATATFGGGLRDGWVSALQHDPLLARWFAHAYAGVDTPPG